MSYFVIQTPAEYDPPATHRGNDAFRNIALHGPFTAEETALSFVEDQHLDGLAGKGSYEFLIQAQDIGVTVVAETE